MNCKKNIPVVEINSETLRLLTCNLLESFLTKDANDFNVVELPLPLRLLNHNILPYLVLATEHFLLNNVDITFKLDNSFENGSLIFYPLNKYGIGGLKIIAKPVITDLYKMSITEFQADIKNLSREMKDWGYHLK